MKLSHVAPRHPAQPADEHGSAGRPVSGPEARNKQHGVQPRDRVELTSQARQKGAKEEPELQLSPETLRSLVQGTEKED